MAKKPFTPPSPKGWDEDGGAWSGPDAIIKRMAWAQAFASQQAQKLEPVKVAQDALGARLTPYARRPSPAPKTARKPWRC